MNIQNISVAGTALLAAGVYSAIGIRNRTCDPEHARALFVSASIALVVAVLALVRAVAPTSAAVRASAEPHYLLRMRLPTSFPRFGSCSPLQRDSC